MSYRRESTFRQFLRKLFTAFGDADRQFGPSTAAPAPPLHVEHGPTDRRRKTKRRR